jgi:hypothetical protein
MPLATNRFYGYAPERRSEYLRQIEAEDRAEAVRRAKSKHMPMGDYGKYRFDSYEDFSDPFGLVNELRDLGDLEAEVGDLRYDPSQSISENLARWTIVVSAPTKYESVVHDRNSDWHSNKERFRQEELDRYDNPDAPFVNQDFPEGIELEDGVMPDDTQRPYQNLELKDTPRTRQGHDIRGRR